MGNEKLFELATELTVFNKPITVESLQEQIEVVFSGYFKKLKFYPGSNELRMIGRKDGYEVEYMFNIKELDGAYLSPESVIVDLKRRIIDQFNQLHTSPKQNDFQPIR